MIRLKVIGTAAAALFATTISAAAFDKCHGPVTGKGKKDHSMRYAMEKAKDAWEKAAEKKHGENYDNWDYSGDRAISCKWDKPGRHFWCNATARPCGRI